MIIGIFVFLIALAFTFGLWKNWPKSKIVVNLKKKLIWSPILRIIMMTWFSTALWTSTWFYSSYGGF